MYEEKCVTEKTKACEKFWKEDGYGGKVWTEDPSKCHWLESDSCHDEPRPKKVSYINLRGMLIQHLGRDAGPQ